MLAVVVLTLQEVTVEDPVGGVDHEEEDEASEIQNKKKVK